MHGNYDYRGFTKSYSEPKDKLLLSIEMQPIFSTDIALRNQRIELTSLWDTGATITAIKPSLRDKLKLRMVDDKHSLTVGGLGKPVKTNYTMTTLFITPNFVLNYCPTYVLDLSIDVDIVIGMDIINMGDFYIDNTNNETSFSFIVPPIPKKMDLMDIAKRIKEKGLK